MNPCQNDNMTFPVTNTIQTIHLQIMKMIRTRLLYEHNTTCIQLCGNHVGFDFKVFEPRKEDWTDVATRLPNDDASGGLDYYVIETVRSSVNENERRSEKRSENDVTENEIRPRSASSRDVASQLNELTSTTKNEDNVTNEVEDAEIVPNGGADITVPGKSGNEEIDENRVPEEKNTIFYLTHPQLY